MNVRYDSPAALTAINALYADLRLLQNLFLRSVKLITKTRVGARLRRGYDAPQTPLARVQACADVDRAKVAALVRLHATLDPFALAGRIDAALERLYRLANHRVSPGLRSKPRVDAAGPMDAKSARTRSLENRTKRGYQRPHASSSTADQVTRVMAR